MDLPLPDEEDLRSLSLSALDSLLSLDLSLACEGGLSTGCGVATADGYAYLLWWELALYVVQKPQAILTGYT